MDMHTFCSAFHRRRAIAALLLIVALLAIAQLVQCQDNDNDSDASDDEDDDGGGNTVDVPLFANIVYDRLMSLTGAFNKKSGNQLKFCIKDLDNDWNQAFNFSGDLRFLVNCIKQKGFFCPRGLTCMIPCPLGAYCPLAKLNKTTGVCDPSDAGIITNYLRVNQIILVVAPICGQMFYLLDKYFAQLDSIVQVQ